MSRAPERDRLSQAVRPPSAAGSSVTSTLGDLAPPLRAGATPALLVHGAGASSASWMMAMAGALGLGPSVLVGHSMGALVALFVAG